MVRLAELPQSCHPGTETGFATAHGLGGLFPHAQHRMGVRESASIVIEQPKRRFNPDFGT